MAASSTAWSTSIATAKRWRLLQFLQQQRGFDFSGYKRPSLVRRVERRMQIVGVNGFDNYIDYLEVHPEEFAQLFNTVLINVTAFFRDAAAWDFLNSERSISPMPGMIMPPLK